MASVTPGLVWAVRAVTNAAASWPLLEVFPVSEMRGPKGAVLSMPPLCLA